MNADEALESLLNRFPELREPIERYREEWKDPDWLVTGPPGLFNYSDDVLVPDFLPALFAEEPGNREALESFFEWLESVMVEGDRYVQNWGKVGLLEYLGSNASW